MHPLIRILSLLVLAAFTPWLPVHAVLVAGLLLLAWGIAKPATGRAMLLGVRRIRWLLLSLLVLFLWFSPGVPVAPVLGPFSPTGAGIELAIHRTGVLLVMVFGGAAFLAGVLPRDLAAGLRQLLAWMVPAPVAMRFAERVGLLLAELPRVEQKVRGSLQRGEGDFAARAAALFRDIESDAARVDRSAGTQEFLPRPPRSQYLVPVMLLAAGIVAALLPGA